MNERKLNFAEKPVQVLTQSLALFHIFLEQINNK